MVLGKRSGGDAALEEHRGLDRGAKRSYMSLVSLTLLTVAGAYIMHLRRELAAARSRGDMYRDFAASLDRQR